MREIFRNRIEAGKLLAEKLMRYANQPNVIVLGLPRGGVPVAFEVAKALRVPLDVFVVRKLGTPGQRELAMGAIATGGVRVLNEEVVEGLGIPIMALSFDPRSFQDSRRVMLACQQDGNRTRIFIPGLLAIATRILIHSVAALRTFRTLKDSNKLV